MSKFGKTGKVQQIRTSSRFSADPNAQKSITELFQKAINTTKEKDMKRQALSELTSVAEEQTNDSPKPSLDLKDRTLNNSKPIKEDENVSPSKTLTQIFKTAINDQNEKGGAKLGGTVIEGANETKILSESVNTKPSTSLTAATMMPCCNASVQNGVQNSSNGSMVSGKPSGRFTDKPAPDEELPQGMGAEELQQVSGSMELPQGSGGDCNGNGDGGAEKEGVGEQKARDRADGEKTKKSDGAVEGQERIAETPEDEQGVVGHGTEQNPDGETVDQVLAEVGREIQEEAKAANTNENDKKGSGEWKGKGVGGKQPKQSWADQTSADEEEIEADIAREEDDSISRKLNLSDRSGEKAVGVKTNMNKERVGESDKKATDHDKPIFHKKECSAGGSTVQKTMDEFLETDFGCNFDEYPEIKDANFREIVYEIEGFVTNVLDSLSEGSSTNPTTFDDVLRALSLRHEQWRQGAREEAVTKAQEFIAPFEEKLDDDLGVMSLLAGWIVEMPDVEYESVEMVQRIYPEDCDGHKVGRLWCRVYSYNIDTQMTSPQGLSKFVDKLAAARAVIEFEGTNLILTKAQAEDPNIRDKIAAWLERVFRCSIQDIYIHLQVKPEPQYIRDNGPVPVIQDDFTAYPPSPITTGFFFRGKVRMSTEMAEMMKGNGPAINFSGPTRGKAGAQIYLAPKSKGKETHANLRSKEYVIRKGIDHFLLRDWGKHERSILSIIAEQAEAKGAGSSIQGVRTSNGVWLPGNRGIPNWHCNLHSMYAYTTIFTEKPGQNATLAEALSTVSIADHVQPTRAMYRGEAKISITRANKERFGTTGARGWSVGNNAKGAQDSQVVIKISKLPSELTRHLELNYGEDSLKSRQGNPPMVAEAWRADVFAEHAVRDALVGTYHGDVDKLTLTVDTQVQAEKIIHDFFKGDDVLMLVPVPPGCEQIDMSGAETEVVNMKGRSLAEALQWQAETPMQQMETANGTRNKPGQDANAWLKPSQQNTPQQQAPPNSGHSISSTDNGTQKALIEMFQGILKENRDAQADMNKTITASLTAFTASMTQQVEQSKLMFQEMQNMGAAIKSIENGGGRAAEDRYDRKEEDQESDHEDVDYFFKAFFEVPLHTPTLREALGSDFTKSALARAARELLAVLDIQPVLVHNPIDPEKPTTWIPFGDNITAKLTPDEAKTYVSTLCSDKVWKADTQAWDIIIDLHDAKEIDIKFEPDMFMYTITRRHPPKAITDGGAKVPNKGGPRDRTHDDKPRNNVGEHNSSAPNSGQSGNGLSLKTDRRF